MMVALNCYTGLLKQVEKENDCYVKLCFVIIPLNMILATMKEAMD